MDSVTIKVPMNIKAKLTEKLKAGLIKESEEAIAHFNLELQQIDMEEKKAEASIPADDIRQLQAMRQHFGAARQEVRGNLAQAQDRLENSKKLAIGAEVIQGKTDRLVELKIGDNVRDLFNVEVLVEDDVVVAIRG